MKSLMTGVRTFMLVVSGLTLLINKWVRDVWVTIRMNMNRRTVLMGLGAAGVGSGALFASGAFTSVEAERTVELDTADDADALLAFEGNNENIIDDDEGQIRIDQDELNELATTRFEDALTVTNNGGENVGLSVDSEESEDGDLLGDGEVLDIRSGGNSIVDDAVDLDTGDENSVDLSIVIDLRGDNEDEELDDIETVVFAARVDDYNNN